MKNICIIQARRKNTRFPNKLLQQLGLRTILAHVIWNAIDSGVFDKIIITSPDEGESSSFKHTVNHPIVSYMQFPPEKLSNGKNNLLKRYMQTIVRLEQENIPIFNLTITRITSDNPFVFPSFIRWVHQLRELAVKSPANEITNKMSKTITSTWSLDYRTFPYGMDLEIFPAEMLEQLAGQTRLSNAELEHVTLGLYLGKKYNLQQIHSPFPDLKTTKLSIDTPEDLYFCRNLLSHMSAEAHCYDETKWLYFLLHLHNLKKVNPHEIN